MLLNKKKLKITIIKRIKHLIKKIFKIVNKTKKIIK
jgi:hypothetical protein